MPELGELAEPDFSRPSFPYAREPQAFSEMHEVPVAEQAEMATPAVRHALLTLDVLRRYPADLPYATEGGIVWRNLSYGGKNGNRPAGLELHQATRPLVAVRRLLKEAHELCADKKTDSITLCGVTIPDVLPEELACPALQNITVYRQLAHSYRTRSFSHMCRLMPGDSGAPDIRERTPYVTEARDGVYMANNAALRDSSDPQATMVPLQSYVHSVHRDFTAEHRAEWAGAFMKHALDGLGALDKADASFMNHRFCKGVSLPEILMRLFEDTNFSSGVLGKQHIHDLSAPMLRALSLAADLVSCVAAPLRADDARAQRAFERLQHTVRHLIGDADKRETLEYILGRGSQLLRDMGNQAAPTRN